MATPVINPIVSHLGYKQWEQWNYQPTATNLSASDNVWTAIGLPTGMSITASTGLISGAAEVAGVFLVRMSVVNASAEASAEVYFPVVIQPSANVQHTGIDLRINTRTGEVTSLEGGSSGGALFDVKSGDDILLVIQWVKDGVAVEMDVRQIQLSLKQYEPEGTLVVGDAFDGIGSGESYYVRLHAAMSGGALEAALSEVESDEGTAFAALAEIEWMEGNDTGVGPSELRRTSRTFRIGVERGLGELTAE